MFSDFNLHADNCYTTCIATNTIIYVLCLPKTWVIKALYNFLWIVALKFMFLFSFLIPVLPIIYTNSCGLLFAALLCPTCFQFAPGSIKFSQPSFINIYPWNVNCISLMLIMRFLFVSTYSKSFSLLPYSTISEPLIHYKVNPDFMDKCRSYIAGISHGSPWWLRSSEVSPSWFHQQQCLWSTMKCSSSRDYYNAIMNGIFSSKSLSHSTIYSCWFSLYLSRLLPCIIPHSQSAMTDIQYPGMNKWWNLVSHMIWKLII